MEQPDGQDPESVALAALELARAGRFEELRDTFVPALHGLVAPDALRAAWDAELELIGPVRAVGAAVVEQAPGGASVVRLLLQGETGATTFVATVARGGRLAGLQLAPADAARPTTPWTAPDYADPDGFDEIELTVGPDPLAVGATLTLPRRTADGPAVVLLAGSGPLDRDETIGPNKPFKDLAWGLATLGIAVARFDKVTVTHPDEVRADPSFTVVAEYLPQALGAIEALVARGLAPGGAFLLGHSLGGTVAPRVAAAAPGIAGIVLLAAGAAPLHWTVVRQVEYLASLDPASASASAPLVSALAEQARRVDGPDLSAETPATELPLGISAPYWLDLRANPAPDLAASLDLPVLCCQGGRDYQATVDDDLARWREALAGARDASFRVYPDDDHLFVRGHGPSSPDTYGVPGHVDLAVVTDVAAWLHARHGGAPGAGA